MTITPPAAAPPPVLARPRVRPADPRFSCGPTSKRPGWSLAALDGATLGRSHRAAEPKAKLAEVIARSRSVLGLPDDWKLGIVAASDTGAVEMAMWSLLGPRPVDVLVWEAFSKDWAVDATKELRLADARVLDAPYGRLPDLARVRDEADVVFAWNGTSSGVRVPDAEWLTPGRGGLAICDATSAAFAMHLPYDRLDVVTWSWQKVLGGEAAHGMLALSPRALERLRTHRPERAIPKIFRLAKDGKVAEGVFAGETINTPSMLCVEDALDALRWAEAIGGLDALVARSEANFAAVARWVERSDWAAFLAEDPRTRSTTSICLGIEAPWFLALAHAERAAAAKALVGLLDAEGVGLDLAAYRDAPPGMRLWGGSTVETSDVEALLPWLDWAHAQIAGRYAAVEKEAA